MNAGIHATKPPALAFRLAIYIDKEINNIELGFGQWIDLSIAFAQINLDALSSEALENATLFLKGNIRIIQCLNSASNLSHTTREHVIKEMLTPLSP